MLFADFVGHMFNHPSLNHLSVVGMFVASRKNRIDNQSAPVHLKRLKSLPLFVSWLDSMAAQGIVIIQHHRIYSRFNYIRPLNQKAPDKVFEVVSGTSILTSRKLTLCEETIAALSS